MRRTHRIAVDALGIDFITTPSLDGVLQSKDQLTVWGKARDQQPQQEVTRGLGRPMRTIQDPVRVDETLRLAQSHDPHARCHRACASGEKRADHQDVGVFPHGLGKERRKLYNQGQQLGR
jgi:hypothetical protein